MTFAEKCVSLLNLKEVLGEVGKAEYPLLESLTIFILIMIPSMCGADMVEASPQG